MFLAGEHSRPEFGIDAETDLTSLASFLMMKYIFVLILAISGIVSGHAQSYAFGVKGGLSLGIQKWNGFGGREPLIRPHGDLFIESHNNETGSSLFAQLGHHTRGSALRFFAYYDPVFNQNIESTTSAIEFRNIVLGVGAKKRYDFGAGKAYYMIGLRGEYTYETEMGGYLFGYEGLENKWLIGALFGGGYEFPFGRFVSGLLEASIHPDFSKQIYLPPQDTGYTDNNGNRIILREQNVANVSIEVTLGLRFLREITYYD